MMETAERNSTPLVTVGIPVYNVEPYVEKCIRSVLEQTYRHLEVVVVDDQGQDGSMRIVETLQREDERCCLLRIVAHDTNRSSISIAI